MDGTGWCAKINSDDLKKNWITKKDMYVPSACSKYWRNTFYFSGNETRIPRLTWFTCFLICIFLL